MEPSSLRMAETAETQGIENKLKAKNEKAIHGAPALPSAKKPKGPFNAKTLSPAITANEETTCSLAISPCKAETVRPQE